MILVLFSCASLSCSISGLVESGKGVKRAELVNRFHFRGMARKILCCNFIANSEAARLWERCDWGRTAHIPDLFCSNA